MKITAVGEVESVSRQYNHDQTGPHVGVMLGISCNKIILAGGIRVLVPDEEAPKVGQKFKIEITDEL